MMFQEYFNNILKYYNSKTEEREPYWLCIEGAVDMVQYYANKKNKIPEFCETIFTELMTEAARYATAQPNEFATCLLINMGIFRVCNFI